MATKEDTTRRATYGSIWGMLNVRRRATQREFTLVDATDVSLEYVDGDMIKVLWRKDGERVYTLTGTTSRFARRVNTYADRDAVHTFTPLEPDDDIYSDDEHDFDRDGLRVRPRLPEPRYEIEDADGKDVSQRYHLRYGEPVAPYNTKDLRYGDARVDSAHTGARNGQGRFLFRVGRPGDGPRHFITLMARFHTYSKEGNYEYTQAIEVIFYGKYNEQAMLRCIGGAREYDGPEQFLAGSRTKRGGGLIRYLTMDHYEDNTTLRGLVVSAVSIVSDDNTLLSDQRMKGLKLSHRWLDDLNTREIKQPEGDCVPSYLLAELRGRGCRRSGKMTLRSIRAGLDKAKGGKDDTGYSTSHIISWLETEKLPVSLYAIGPTGKVFGKHVYKSSKKEHITTLTFMCSDNHLHPICRGKEFACAVARTGVVPIELEAQWSARPDETFVAESPEDLQKVLDGNISRCEYKVIAITPDAWTHEIQNPRGLMAAVVEMTKMSTLLKYAGGRLIGFQDPRTGQGVVETEDYYSRKKTCDALFDETNGCSEFHFSDTSESTMARNWYKYCGDTTRPSHFTKQHEAAIQEYSPRAVRFGSTLKDALLRRNTAFRKEMMRLVDTARQAEKAADASLFSDNRSELIKAARMARQAVDEYTMPPVEEDDVCQAFDIKKSYLNCLLDNTWEYPVYAIHDNPVRYTGGELLECGEYLVDRFTIPQLGGVHITRQLMNTGLVQWLVEQGYLTKDKIIYEYKPSYSPSSDTFKDATIRLRELCPDTYKGPINKFVGLLGRKNNTETSSFVCSTLETAAAAWLTGISSGRDVSFSHAGECFVITDTTKTRLSRDNTAAHRVIISHGIKKMLTLIQHYYVPGQSVLVGVKTDCVYIHHPRKTPLPSIYREEKPHGCPDETTADTRNDFNHSLLGPSMWNEVDAPVSGESGLLVGPAGSGKTTMLTQVADKAGSLVLCPTNTAVENLTSCGFAKGQAFHNDTKYESLLRAQTEIIVDEYSMCDIPKLAAVYEHSGDARVLVAGDCNQIEPVGNAILTYDEDGEEVWRTRRINLEECQFFRDICGGNRTRLKYRPDAARYGAKLYEALVYLLETGKLHPMWKNNTVDCLQQNICYTNATREEIIADRTPFIKAGMTLIATDNIKRKKYSINNSTLVYLREIKSIETVKDGITTTVHKYRVSKFDKDGTPLAEDYWVPTTCFVSAACVTAHRYQGKTIHGPYCIFEIEKMTLNMLYVALSRAKSWDQIRFKYTNKIFQRRKMSSDTWRIPTTASQIGALVQYNNEDYTQVFFQQVSHIEQIEETFKRNVNNTLYPIDNTWSHQRYSRHILRTHRARPGEEHTAIAKTASELLRHRERVLARYGGLSECLNKEYAKLSKKQNKSDDKHLKNVLQNQLTIKQCAKEFRIQKNGIRKSFRYSTTGRRGLTREEALLAAQNYLNLEYLNFFE